MEKNRSQDRFHLCAENVAITKPTWKFPTPLFLQRAQADQVVTVYVWRARPRLIDADAEVRFFHAPIQGLGFKSYSLHPLEGSPRSARAKGSILGSFIPRISSAMFPDTFFGFHFFLRSSRLPHIRIFRQWLLLCPLQVSLVEFQCYSRKQSLCP